MPSFVTRFVFCTLPLMAAGLAAFAHSATCQNVLNQGTSLEDLPEQARRYYRVVRDTDDVYQVTFDGSIHRNFVYGRVYMTPLPLVELLSEPTIAGELEIVESQREQLEQHVIKLQRACEHADTAFAKWRLDRDRLEKETLQILEPAIDDANRTIRETLLDFQTDRFRQILIQLEINRRGLLWFFESKFGDEIGLSQNQREALRKRYVDEIQIALNEIQNRKKKVVDELFSNVPNSVRTDILQSLGGEPNLYRTPLMLLLVQIGEDAIVSFREFDIESQWPKYAGISLPFSFKVNISGQVVYAPATADAEQVDRQIPGFLMIYCLSGKDFELVSWQSDAIAELRRQQTASWQSEVDSINQFIQSNNTHVLPLELKRQLHVKRQAFNSRMVETIENILLPHQLAVMEEFAARTRYSLHGPVAYILNYEKQTEGFSLTDSQAGELQSTATAMQETAQNELVRLERRLNQRMFDKLTIDQRERLKMLIGSWLDLERGNLEFHAMFIDRPEEMWGLNQTPVWMKEIEVDPRALAPSSGEKYDESPDNN